MFFLVLFRFAFARTPPHWGPSEGWSIKGVVPPRGFTHFLSAECWESVTTVFHSLLCQAYCILVAPQVLLISLVGWLRTIGSHQDHSAILRILFSLTILVILHAPHLHMQDGVCHLNTYLPLCITVTYVLTWRIIITQYTIYNLWLTLTQFSLMPQQISQQFLK